jgi:hypothetical protein
MWSDRYYYLNIVPDLALSSGHSTEDLIAFLRKQKELVQVSDFKFRNSSDFSIFVDIQLLKANSYDSWSDKDVSHEITNMIAVVCSKGDQGKYELAKNVLIRIAAYLGWQLIDERTNEGVENHLLWKPSSISD